MILSGRLPRVRISDSSQLADLSQSIFVLGVRIKDLSRNEYPFSDDLNPFTLPKDNIGNSNPCQWYRTGGLPIVEEIGNPIIRG
jgi:hypothetical protein